jgi:hypothetical protein
VRIVDTCGASARARPPAPSPGRRQQPARLHAGRRRRRQHAASRSGFYELNKLAEQARGWLPANTWLNAQLTVEHEPQPDLQRVLEPRQHVNFYRSGGGCRNTGEIAAVFDHEWGHGLDDNDAAASVELARGYADIAAIYRLQTSCVGYGFFQTDDGCGQTADGTGFNTNENQTGAALHTNCSGVRDADYGKHSDTRPTRRRTSSAAPASPHAAPADARCTARPRPVGRRPGTSWRAT